MDRCNDGVSIPKVNNDSIGCDFIIETDCIKENGKTQKQINAELREELAELREIIMNITFTPQDEITFDVALVSYDGLQINVINILMSVLGISQGEAQLMIDNLPAYLGEDISLTAAVDLRDTFIEEGTNLGVLFNIQIVQHV